MYRKISPAVAHSNITRSIESEPPPTKSSEASEHIVGKTADIWSSFAVLCLPPLTFSALLLGLVYAYRVTSDASVISDPRTSNAFDEPGVCYVRLSATVLIFIASWSSSVAPLLVGVMMNLASYPISRKYWEDIRGQQPDLLTPYQLALVIKFIAASGWGALYRWMEYLVGWRKQRQAQSRVLTSSASVALLAITLGLLVFLADTWLHITTSTINFVQIGPLSRNSNNHSLSLMPQCLESDNSLNKNNDCNFIVSGDSSFLVNAAQSIQTLNNLSETVAVFNDGPDPTYAYLGIPNSEAGQVWDFTAKTFGIRTQCKPVSDACNLVDEAGASTPFRCTGAFTGNLGGGSNGWQEAYFPDQTMNQNDSGTSQFVNPFYYGVAALFRDAAGLEGANLVTPTHGGTAFVLLCSITIFDIEYDSINETVTRLVASPSNTTASNVWSVPVINSDLTTQHLQIAALTAALLAKDAQDLADQFAVAYSKIALAVGAQSVQGAPALAAQERDTFLVTRLPLAPLFSLIAANLLFVVVGVVLTVVALLNSGGEASEIQSRLSIAGLVADRFESTRAGLPMRSLVDAFQEHEGRGSSHVVIERSTAGGYRYKSWVNMQ